LTQQGGGVEASPLLWLVGANIHIKYGKSSKKRAKRRGKRGF